MALWAHMHMINTIGQYRIYFCLFQNEAWCSTIIMKMFNLYVNDDL